MKRILQDSKKREVADTRWNLALKKVTPQVPESMFKQMTPMFMAQHSQCVKKNGGLHSSELSAISDFIRNCSV